MSSRLLNCGSNLRLRESSIPGWRDSSHLFPQPSLYGYTWHVMSYGRMVARALSGAALNEGLMRRLASCSRAIVSGVCLLTLLGGVAWSAAEVYTPSSADDARNRVLAWLGEQGLPDAQRDQVMAIWSGVDASTSADLLLERVIQSFALVQPEVMRLVNECNTPPQSPLPPRADFLIQSTQGPFFQANMNLFYGRHLVERRLFDEAWEVLKSVDPRQVVDPSSLFFFQAVAAQGMLELKPALDAIEQLLTNTERVPVRYSATATLMQTDLKGLEEKSLGELARLMADSERRLDLGRAGDKVQGVQERIIANLDEIIKKVEQQQGGGGGGGGDGQGGNSNNPGGAADDSRVKGEEAPGETDKKRFENKGSWGNLPEKDLAKAKNDLNKNFPSNYEQAIEKYTKKLAGRAAKKNKQ